MNDRQPLIIGHRGAAGEAPENTLASFQLAVSQGAGGLELDIHVSADGELVVCHDESVDRTTDGRGMICEMSVKELKQLDAGSWFAPSFSAERLPLLQEVFDFIPAEIMINVEVKCPYSDQLEKRLLELLVQYNRLSSVVISSFNHKTLVQLKRKEPALQIGLLYSANPVHHHQIAEIVGEPVFSLHPHYKLIDAADVSDAIQHGLQVYAWTINGEAELQQALEAGYSGIITDFPARLKGLLEAAAG